MEPQVRQATFGSLTHMSLGSRTSIAQHHTNCLNTFASIDAYPLEVLLIRVQVSAHYCTTPASSVEDKGASVHDYFAHYFAPASADIF